MDDQKLREISERLDYLRGLDKRREQIAASIAEQGKMTAELEKKLSAAATLSELMISTARISRSAAPAR